MPSYEAVFRPIQQSDPGKPFVVAQLGQSMDGRIATVTGASRYINGSAALDHLHRLRARVDAVIVGVGTVIADDPQLTVRRVKGPTPTRVIIDPRGRVPAGARCLCDGAAPVLIVTACGRQEPQAARAAAVPLPLYGGQFDPHQIVAALAARGFRRLLVEGGAKTVSSFIAAGAVDRLHLLVAPVIIGSGVSGLNLPPIATLEEALRPHMVAHPLPSGDVLFDCDLRGQRADKSARPLKVLSQAP
ncbi:RibD family protein [Rhodoligotrophos defluvii]|uniref:RibD family protein n=1 Tax=Rhodoligotrophos defluvii TaxID=2561934 RepID=UPI0019609192|nr:RibD family protein [Rhodoligotrophos defluvii]